MNEITIGYLSWKKHNILKQTLKSHQKNGLFDIIKPQNRIIFFQEISQRDKNIAKKYELNILGNKEKEKYIEKTYNNLERRATVYLEPGIIKYQSNLGQQPEWNLDL